MGKRQKIRSGAGDVVSLPGSLHKQIEKSKVAKKKMKFTKQINEHIDEIIPELKACGKEDNDDGDTTKFKAKERIIRFAPNFGESDEKLSAETEELYKDVSIDMAKYRTEKLPLPFIAIPNMPNWEQLLELTRPENWSTLAVHKVTKLFTMSEPNKSQRFYNLVLLPRVRQNIYETKKLDVHLCESLFKSVFRTAAFFKGIILPLCDSGTCTLREATLIGSVMRKASIPMLHAAAAMLKIAEMDYSGANSIFLRVLIEKCYTLPFRVIDGLVFHFLKANNLPKNSLVVLWHQSLLAFVQQYREDMSSEQREALLELLKVQQHYKITGEVRHLLRGAKSRNEESEANVPNYARDDAMES